MRRERHPRHRDCRIHCDMSNESDNREDLSADVRVARRAILSHFSAGALWDMVEWDDRHIEVTVKDTTPRVHASQLPDHSARRAVRQAVSRRWLNVRQVLEILERQPRRPGAKRLRTIVAAGPLPTRTELEDVVLDVILAPGLGRPDVNVPMELDGRRIVPDFRWPERKLVRRGGQSNMARQPAGPRGRCRTSGGARVAWRTSRASDLGAGGL